MLGFDALDAAAFPGEQSPGDVPVVHGDQANFAFDGTAYAPTTDFAFGAPAAPTTVQGSGAATLSLTGTADATFTAPAARDDGTGAGALTLTGAATGAHGVAGAATGTLAPSASGQGGHGIAGAAAGTLAPTAAAGAAHGIAGGAAGSLTPTATAAALHLRYEVRGEVRLSGTLVTRRVRVYLRATGALIADVDTVAGKFHAHTGFAPVEHYIVPINLDDTATDWAPPVANRVVSALAQDV